MYKLEALKINKQQLNMEKISTQQSAVGRKIAVGKVVMNTIRKSKEGFTVEELKTILYNRDNSILPTLSEINATLEKGLQRKALTKEGKLYKAADNKNGKEIENTYTCGICLEDKKMRNGARLVCKHIFCMTCIGSWSSIRRTCPCCESALPPTCPLCRRRLEFSRML